MRVIIYVPPSPGSARTRRAVEREVRKRGHEVVGVTDSRAEAQLALSASVADQVAGRPEHLLDLAPCLMGIPRAATSKAALLLLPITWLVDQVRDRPIQGTVIAATLAGAASVSMTLTPTIVPTPPEVLPPSQPVEVPAEPVRPQPSTTAPLPEVVPSITSTSVPIVATPTPAATTPAPLAPTQLPVVVAPSPAPPPPAVQPSAPTAPEPARSAMRDALPSPEPSPSCLIRARVDPASVRACVHPPSGLD
jgi:hypothetical protein